MKQTVLFADGDPELCELCRGFATQRGYEAAASLDGLDCVRRLRQAAPDVLVLNLELLWGGGDGLLGWLREEPQFLPRRIVLTSTAASAHTFNSLASPPVVQTLRKPFSLHALFDGPAFVALDGRPQPSNGGPHRGILVVDDEPALRDVLQRLLQCQGFHVWTAAGGKEALDHCCDHSADIALILLDVRMPGLDGPQTLDGIRDLNADVPVCFMTGDPGDYEPSDLLRRGARHVFQKPFRLDELIRVVSSLTNEPNRVAETDLTACSMATKDLGQ
jgi:CheY-like chemotaxis protein